MEKDQKQDLSRVGLRYGLRALAIGAAVALFAAGVDPWVAAAIPFGLLID